MDFEGEFISVTLPVNDFIDKYFNNDNTLVLITGNDAYIHTIDYKMLEKLNDIGFFDTKINFYNMKLSKKKKN